MVKSAVPILVLIGMAFTATISAKAERKLSFPADRNGIVQFTTPAKEVGCTYIPFDGAGGIETGTGTSPELHCYTLTGELKAFSLGADGRARKLVVRGKLDCCKGRNVLAYGSTWVTGGYSCTAKKGGLSCKRGKTVVSIGPRVPEGIPSPKK